MTNYFSEHGFHDSGNGSIPQCLVNSEAPSSIPSPDLDFSAKGEECIPQTWDMFHEK